MFKSRTINSANAKPGHTSLFQNEPDEGAFIQPKLQIGKSGDLYEIEADRVADAVVSLSKDRPPSFFKPWPEIQKQPEEVQNQEENEREIQQRRAQESISPLVQEQPGEEIEQVQNREFSEQTNGEIGRISRSVDLQTQEEDVREKEDDETEDDAPENDIIQPNARSEAPEDPRVRSVSGRLQHSHGSIESQLDRSKGHGSPLPKEARSQMESGFGRDFSGVKIHTDSQAVQMNRTLGAQAFTHGNDIYFNEGKFDTASDEGQHLLAHELTHTIQQGASIRPKVIQKADETDPDDLPEFPMSSSKYNLETAPPRIFIASLPVPPIKDDPSKIPGEQLFKANNFSRKDDNDPAQILKWQGESDNSAIKTKLESHGFIGNHSYAIRHRRKADTLRIGDSRILSRRLLIPYWNDNNEYTEFDVDHFVELQTAGWPRQTWGNNIGNYWLLDSNSNQTSGRKLDTSIKNTVADQVKQDQESTNALKSLNIDVIRLGNNQDIFNAIKNRFDIYFNRLTGDSNLEVGSSHSWERNKILTGNHIDTLMQGRANNPSGRESKEIKVYDLQDAQPQASKPFNNHDENVNAETLGSSSLIRIFRDAFGAAPFNIPWDQEENEINLSSGGSTFVNLSRGIKGIVSPTFIRFDRASQNPEAGHLLVNLKQLGGAVKLEVRQGLRWPIHRVPGAQYAGYLELTDLMEAINNAQPNVNVFSPADVQAIYFDPDKGIIATGDIASNLPIFNDLDLQYEIEEDDFKIFKIFSFGDFNVPSPFEISEVSLILSVGTGSGIGVEGRVNFGIDRLGEGFIGAAASTSGGFELEGAFNFDSNLFDPAEINVEYKENTWTIGGEIGIPEGKVRGIRHAVITASYSGGNFTATGEATLDIPGIERGNMTVNYGDDGFSISGNFNLSPDVPGIRGGHVEAHVSKREGAESYDVFVSGTAQPDIPGVTSSLAVTYENGALTIEGNASYSRGMLSGSVNVGATNRTIGGDGQPTGAPDDTMRVYGGGSLTLQLTPWLQATAGVQFLPNGEIEVTGRIALPSTVDVFDRREFRRNLFTVPTIEIPLFAIPLGPRSLGLVAQISGGLDFSAGFGPGQLRDVSAEVTYNPDREDETVISGHGAFAIPADAGLTLRGDLGLGLSIAIASLSGGIELAGTLGLEGEAAAEVDLSWSPQTGIVLDAEGRIMVNPKFTFDVNAFARASLGIGWFSISETWRYNLVSFSWGPDIQFGIVFPIHYQEDRPFDISFEDLEVIYPDLDVVDMAKDLARDLKDDIFD
ncbi:MAG: DUF4157 domain-containing protein [Cytophagales bacterium]|nr:DUF4157 domain-containing protein [Cytophagales bacterium]